MKAAAATKNALVIGATGYVGSAITKGLIEHGGVGSIKCTTRNVDNAGWLKDLAVDIVPSSSSTCAAVVPRVDVVPLELNNNNGDDGKDETIRRLKELMIGIDMVFFCAGFETQSQSTIDFMVSNAVAVVEAAKCTENTVSVVVLTSSGGSTNPPSLKDSTPKNELIHFSDPDEQISRKRFSPAAKTLMEINSFRAVGRNHKNEIIDETVAENPSTPRLVVINPNLILGPHLDPGPKIHGNSLPWIIRILKKESMNEYVPNDSMSIIDVRDLASLHVAAAFDEKASGRYFGVNQSYPWRTILNEFRSILPDDYRPPPLNPNEDYDSKVPTQFDHARKNSLGVKLRPLHDTLQDLIEYFKSKHAL